MTSHWPLLTGIRPDGTDLRLCAACALVAFDDLDDWIGAKWTAPVTAVVVFHEEEGDVCQ